MYRPRKKIHFIFLVKNRQHQIEWHLRKVILQTSWQSVQLYITVIDGGSTDSTVKIIHSIAQTYPLQLYKASDIYDQVQLLTHILLTTDSEHEFIVRVV
jgi:hypothetical protein